MTSSDAFYLFVPNGIQSTMERLFSMMKRTFERTKPSIENFKVSQRVNPLKSVAIEQTNISAKHIMDQFQYKLISYY